MKDETKKNGVAWGMFMILIIIAILADGLTLIPIVGSIVGPAYWVIFSWYLKRKGYGIFNLKTLVPEGFSILIEILPALQALPTISLMTAIILALTKVEDKVSISRIPHIRFPKKSGPLNQSGVRLPRKDNVIKADFSTKAEEDELAA